MGRPAGSARRSRAPSRPSGRAWRPLIRDPMVLDLASQLAQSLGLIADVTDYAAVARVADDITDHFGRCDHVVFAVGVGSGKFGFPFWNLDAGRLGPRARGQPDRRGQRGARLRPGAGRAARSRPASMLFLSSVAGQIGSQTDPPYSAAKAAVINFAQCAAKDLAPYGVRVNTLCPGMVQTAAQPRGLRGLGHASSPNPSGRPTKNGPPTRSRSSSP